MTADDTVASPGDATAAVPCADETVVVAPPTEPAPELAWSHEEPATEVFSGRPWRSAWVIAGVGVTCAVVIALIVVGVGIMAHRGNTSRNALGVPSISVPPPPAFDADKSKYAAYAVSLRAIASRSDTRGGFGTGSTQDQANRVALSDCRGGTGNDDCLLVDHGNADERFLAAMQSDQIIVENRAVTIRQAHWICDQFAQGLTRDDVTALIPPVNKTPIVIQDFEADSIAFYCPQYAGR